MRVFVCFYPSYGHLHPVMATVQLQLWPLGRSYKTNLFLFKFYLLMHNYTILMLGWLGKQIGKLYWLRRTCGRGKKFLMFSFGTIPFHTRKHEVLALRFKKFTKINSSSLLHSFLVLSLVWSEALRVELTSPFHISQCRIDTLLSGKNV